VEVETIGRVRHKNLVRLLGYCVEGAYRYNYRAASLSSCASSTRRTLVIVNAQWKLDSFSLLWLNRMLVYEYVDNGNLDQWLHGDVGEVSPLTWDIRMNIVLSTAKG
jgi:hypothetical protein